MKKDLSSGDRGFRVVILGSGHGSNAEAIIQAEIAGKLGSASVVAIIADSPGARIIDVAALYGVPGHYLHPGPYRTRIGSCQENLWIRTIQFYRPDLIVLAGFMRVVKQRMLRAFDGMLINIHPSLLPKWPGLNSIQRAFEAGDSEVGCTVHRVSDVVDGGEILGQSSVAVAQGDTLESLTGKVHAAEHQLLPSIIARLSIGK